MVVPLEFVSREKKKRISEYSMRKMDLPKHIAARLLQLNLYCLRRLTDQIEMALFVLRYVCNLLIFALGLRAPGITGSDSDYRVLNDGSTTQSRFYQRVSTRN